MTKYFMSLLAALWMQAAFSHAAAQDDADTNGDLSGSVEVEAPSGIDWRAANKAFQTAKVEGFSSGVVGIEKLGRKSVVPVLLPTEIVLPPNTGVTFSSTASGYFAVYPGANFDLIVNGAKSDQVLAPGEIFYQVRGVDTQVKFSKFGANYHLEFECRVVDASSTCLDEAEARDITQRMFVAVAPDEEYLGEKALPQGEGS